MDPRVSSIVGNLIVLEDLNLWRIKRESEDTKWLRFL